MAHIKVSRDNSRRIRRARVIRATEFPPALATVIVLVIHHKTRFAHHWPDPAHAVIAIVAILFEAVAQEKSLRRAVVHVDAKHIRGERREDPLGRAKRGAIEVRRLRSVREGQREAAEGASA